jgi:hypothetical protein
LKSADPKLPVAEVTQGGVTVSILSADGQIHTKDNALDHSRSGAIPSLQRTESQIEHEHAGMVMHSGANKERWDGGLQGGPHAGYGGDWSVDISTRTGTCS